MDRRTIDNLYALTIPEIQEVFLRVMQDTVDRAILDEMVRAIESNDLEALYRTSGFTPAVLAPILDRIEKAYLDAGSATVGDWPSVIRTPAGLTRPIFNMRNPRVESLLRDHSSQLVTQISDEIRGSVRLALEDGLARGQNPRATALDIVGRINPATRKREGGVLGLTTKQTQWSLSARRYLETLDESYFNMRLRDKRFDKTVRKAIESGKPLDAQTVGKLVSAYNNRAIKYRGEMVARTETLQSLNEGERLALEQGVEEGLFNTDQIEKWWDDAGDFRTRPSHRALGNKYNRKNPIPFDEPFISPLTGAQMMQPGDTSLGAGAKDIVHCRCAARYRVEF